MKNRGFHRALIMLGLFVLTAVVSCAQLNTLTSFNYTNSPYGIYPTGALVQGVDGNLYGTTYEGGAYWNAGTVFKITPSGVFTTIYGFTDQGDGGYPEAGLALGTDGNLYGTCNSGGSAGYSDGDVFKVTPTGQITVLHSFEGYDGQSPESNLTLAANGTFWGMTDWQGPYGAGTIFQMTPTGSSFLTMFGFADSSSGPGQTDGCEPYYDGLIQAGDGNFYGTTDYCGAYNQGTVFKITQQGQFTLLWGFTGGPDGGEPYGSLVQGSNGNFYGTTYQGGNNGYGTVFEITPAGSLTTLYSFTGQADGGYPSAGLTLASDGNFYGTTYDYGLYGYGTVFKMSPSGSLTTVWTFTGGTDGGYTYDNQGLMQATDGHLYGTTSTGGAYGWGTVYQLSMGLSPNVKAVPHAGAVGTKVLILGSALADASKVTFNGTSATFTVVSATEITTTVPSGATAGMLSVTTPHGTLKGVYQVVPAVTTFSPTSGVAGQTVKITGSTLTGAKGVTFGGVPATSYTVNSSTQITATVPTGAVTGPIGVTGPTGWFASSTASFNVK